MPAIRKCRGCGADVPNNAPFGHCPKCLLELGFGPLPEAPEAPSPGRSGGRSFGDYELLEQIGRGGMGIIYKARQVTLNRLVALKMVRASEFASPTLIQRFHLEAEAAANLHHPNIVSIYETGDHQGEHFFSMALVDGLGLDRYITTGGFCFDRKAEGNNASTRTRQEQTARLMVKIARAVDFAHQHGVLHRDLKPSNVILDRQSEPHLTDFGVAKVIGQAGISLTASGAIIGTPSYMAPEQAVGQSKRATTAADVYSLGAILYEMLTGQPPFRGDTPVETLKQVVEQEPRHPTTFEEGVDRDLATICMKCLEKEPQRRYGSAAALAEDLERWLRKEPILARPVNTAGRVWRWCRRNPKEAVLGGAVFLLLVMIAMGATAVAIHINGLNTEKERNNTELRAEMFTDLSNLYTNVNVQSVVISSKRRRTLFGLPPQEKVGLEFRYVEHLYTHPTNMLNTLAPILDYAEESLGRKFGIRVAVHMQLHRGPEATYQALASGEAAFGRMGPASYIYVEAQRSGARLLAVQDHIRPLTLALIARADSEIARMRKASPGMPLAKLLAGRLLGLTHSNSTTGNFLAKRHLATNGVFARDLSGYSYFGGQEQVIDAVLTNGCDVGAGNLEVVGTGPSILVLEQFEVPNLGRCWVAGKGLPAEAEKHLRGCLIGLNDRQILKNLESGVSGFKAMDTNALENLRVMMREAEAFDAGPNRSAP